MSNYYKKTIVASRRTTTVTLKGGGTMTTTSLNVLLQEVGLNPLVSKMFDPTWREDTTRGLTAQEVNDINRLMVRIAQDADFLKGILGTSIDVRG